MLLEIHGLTARYGDFQALFGVDLAIDTGELVAVVGSNGAGKSTLLNTIAGLLPCTRAAVTLDGAPIGGLPAHRVVAQGIALVPEGRRLFPSLSVEENLLVGSYAGRTGRWTLAAVYELFPQIAARRRNPANALSGGEQQMVAIGRALMSNPRVLLCDELSLGLAPRIISALYERLGELVRQGLAVIAVEQDVSVAQRVSRRMALLRQGRIALTGDSAALTRAAISQAYFGVAA